MIAVDTNILVYAHRAESAWHRPAKACITRLAEGLVPWMIPWPCVHEFLAVVTSSRIFTKPTPLVRALAQVELWLESPALSVQGESRRHWETARRLIESSRVTGSMVHDARIAAVCIDHGVTSLWTADRDFSRFSELRTMNPLVRQAPKYKKS